ncbi:MAG: hypothetical protein ACYC0B_02945 [Gemmatimonadaceae bacterium]
MLQLLERRGTKARRDGFARYGIVAPKSYGVGSDDRAARATGTTVIRELSSRAAKERHSK